MSKIANSTLRNERKETTIAAPPRCERYEKCIYLPHPISNKNIGIMCAAIISVAAEDDFFTIITKHWKSIKTLIATDFFNSSSIRVHNIHVKRKASFVFVIAAEYNSSVGQKIRRPIGLSKRSNLSGITAVCVCNKNFHLNWRNQTL